MHVFKKKFKKEYAANVLITSYSLLSLSMNRYLIGKALNHSKNKSKYNKTEEI